jgi:DNA helicase HerA-like ATPase
MDPLKIGHVIGVHGDHVEVQISVGDLHIEYHGTTYRVGRLGTYVTLPMDRHTLIGYVTRVGAEGELEPLPNPGTPRCITMTVQLIGTIRNDQFTRGVNKYPTLGDTVRLAIDEDFELIFGCFDDLAADQSPDAKKAADTLSPKAFSLGRFAVDTDFEVRALGKEFFAKHAAIMGNSGSGKSVTTAKIAYEALKLPHTQIVLFDMHGEYRAAFSDERGELLPNVSYLSDRNLVLPYWMLQYSEFEKIFIDTNNPLNINAQKVFLRLAFEQLKQVAAEELDLLAEYTIDTPVFYPLEQLKTYALNMNDARFVLNTENYAFSRLPYRQLPVAEQEALLRTRRMEFNRGNAEGEVPHATFYGRLLGLVNQIETRLNDRRYDFLLRPREQALRNVEIVPFLNPETSPGEASKSLGAIIRQFLGRLSTRKNLTIIDLSGLPFDVVDITVATITRTLFDFNFWAPPEVRQPFVLVFEEAHNYLPRKDRSTAMFAREAVEKVAKEGRKYGVSAMIVTQRPSEISETILSQCNSMVLMRMNNPDDQDYVARVVSDQFRSLISLLPSMKPGEGFIIGDSVLMPMRTLIDLPPRLPRSGDVDFFKLWSTGTQEGDVEQIVDRWWRQDRAPATPTDAAPGQPAVPPTVEIPAPASSPAPASAGKVQQRIAELAALLSGNEK